ncbi:hypothetical protein OG976_17760 [Mycobacterium sp. NBC_00419]|uniref:hypothetical protein n=1 Tax=Mycobacterium sp. NBC_00419 TaxID=2975989 RepID=UPI002E21D5E9
MSSAPVRIYNPLHNVLAHFTDRLIGSLASAGVSSAQLSSRNGEVGSNRYDKALALAAHLRNARKYVEAAEPTIVAWPLLGWLEMPLWRHRNHQTLIAMHDPQPLVRQNGLSPRAAAFSAAASGSQWPHVVTMSPEAYDITSKYFDERRVHMVPHPMSRPNQDPVPETSRTVLVLGQFKSARDLDVMASIAPELARAGWRPMVVGRGWPAIAGWEVVNRFVTEEEFEQLLASSAALLLPYKYYFQSGVALRALEAGLPVVGRSSGFLTSILGADFPGAVEDWDSPTSWVAAVHAATSGRVEQLCSATAYSMRGAQEWRDLIAMSSGA